MDCGLMNLYRGKRIKREKSVQKMLSYGRRVQLLKEKGEVATAQGEKSTCTIRRRMGILKTIKHKLARSNSRGGK